MELESKPVLIDTAKWKNELKCNGVIICDKESCKMGFLSLRGMRVHHQKCVGHLNEGDFVICPVCHIRFKTFSIMQRHQEKQHKQQVIASAFTQKPAVGHSDLFLKCKTERKVETPTELRDRILAESRLISVVRPPGRLIKVKLQSPLGQSTPKTKMKIPRFPAVQQRVSGTSSIENGGKSSSYRLLDYNPPIASTPQPSSITYDQPIKTPGSQEELYDREKQLAVEETILRDYQEGILTYDKSAEDATRVALQEKELCSNKLAEELKQQELMNQSLHKDFFCTQCSLQFGKKYVFDLHLSLVHGKVLEIKNEAKDYEENFSEAKKDEEKVLIAPFHEKKKQFICELCDYSASRKEHLKRHVSSLHEKKKAFKCEICNYSCSQKGHMKTHVASVHEEKQFKCELCEHICSRKDLMKRHLQNVHEKKKPFKCEICGYSCSQKDSLKKHLVAVHENKKPFKCELCDYKSSIKAHLKRHVQIVHEKKKPFKCEICDKVFSIKQSMTKHIIAIHEKML